MARNPLSGFCTHVGWLECLVTNEQRRGRGGGYLNSRPHEYCLYNSRKQFAFHQGISRSSVYYALYCDDRQKPMLLTLTSWVFSGMGGQRQVVPRVRLCCVRAPDFLLFFSLSCPLLFLFLPQFSHGLATKPRRFARFLSMKSSHTKALSCWRKGALSASACDGGQTAHQGILFTTRGLFV